MDKRPSQVSFYLAIVCLTLSICLFLVVVGVLYQKWTTPMEDGQPTGPDIVQQDDDVPLSFAMEDLKSKLGRPLPAPLGGGRVLVSPPKNWFPRSRSKEYLARFDTKLVSLPRITVTVEEAESDEPLTATLVQDSIPDEDQKRVLEKAKPITLGDKDCIRYVMESKLTRFKNSKPRRYERQVLKTLHEGRIYIVTLDVFSGTMEQFRDAGYAVMAGLQFVTPEEEAEED